MAGDVPELSRLDGPYEPMIVPAGETWDDPSLLLNWLRDDEPAYRYGFYQAAYTIAVGMVNHTGPRSEALAYPMIWCFRQFVEVSLKRIISIGCDLDFYDDALSVRKEASGHNLDALWIRAEPALRIVGLGDLSNDFFRRVNDIVAELHGLDPRSTAFRYATTHQDRRSLGPGHLVLRVNRFVDNMDVAMNWLSDSIQILERRAKRVDPCQDNDG